MKSSLLRIFGDGACAKNNGQSITIKQEPVYYTQQKKPMSSQRSTNPLNKRTKCAICQSVYHWAKDCPNKAASNSVKSTESETIENCNLTLFTKEHPSINEVFAIESSCSAVLDTVLDTVVDTVY